MDSLDNETIEQIKNIVNDAKNNNPPLQKAKRTKKLKVVENVTSQPKVVANHLQVEPDSTPNVELDLIKPDVVKRPKLTRSKSVKTNINVLEPVVEPVLEPVLEPVIEAPVEEAKPPEKKKRVQSEKQKAAFLL